jgi:putative oxidoreductase
MDAMLKTVLSPFADKSYALLRIVAGLMFSFHGMQKILGLFGHAMKFGDNPQFWIGGVIELVAGIAIAIGLFTRCAAFVASGTMAVAYFQFHWKFQFGEMFFPTMNKGELAVLYCWVFLYIACKGAGPWSVDAKRERRANAS